MRPAFRLIAPALAASLAMPGCHRAVAQAALPADTVITLERGACYGNCPIYRISLHGDGRVEFHGERDVAHVGNASAKVAPAAVRALLERFGRAGFHTFDERYGKGAAACRHYAADAPVVVLTVTRGGAVKRVEHDHGCVGAPPALTSLEQAVDSTAESARWTTSSASSRPPSVR